MRKKFYLHSIELLEDIRFFLLIPRDFLSQVRGLLLPPFCFSRLLRNNAVQGDCSNEKLSCPGLNPVAQGIDPPNTHRGRFLFLSFTVGKDVYQNKNVINVTIFAFF